MNIKLTKYAHSIIILSLGLFIVMNYKVWYTSFIGGLLMGYSLKVARQSGIESTKIKEKNYD